METEISMESIKEFRCVILEIFFHFMLWNVVMTLAVYQMQLIKANLFCLYIFLQNNPYIYRKTIFPELRMNTNVMISNMMVISMNYVCIYMYIIQFKKYYIV